MTRRRGAPAEHANRTIAILATGTLAFSLQQTMILPALPAFQDRYGVSPSSSAWLLTAFLLSSAVTTPILGRLGDIHGKARMLLVALVIFAAGSALAALAGSFAVVLAGRTVQGAGAAIMPLAIGIARDELPAERVGLAIGTLSSMLGIGGGAALLLAGFLLDHLGIAWLFWSGLVVTGVAAVLTLLFVPESPVRSPAKVDVVGAVVLAAALVGLLLAVSEGNAWGWGSARIAGVLAAAAAAAGLWVVWERRAASPFVDLALMRRREVWTTNVVAMGIGAAMFGSFVLIPQLAQAPVSTGYGFGDGVAQAGLVMLPCATAMLLAGVAAGGLGARVGARHPLWIGCIAAAASYVWFAALHAHEWQLYVGSAILGIGLGLGMSAMANLVVHAVPQRQTGIATAINMISRSIGGAVGAQAAAAILTASAVRGALPAESGYAEAFLLCAGAAVLAWAGAIAFPRRAQAPAQHPAVA